MDIELSIIKEEQYDTNYGGRYLCRLCEEGKLKNRGFPQKQVYRPMNAHYIVNE